jgi:thiol-disulfide isomerase/thioredoxin
MKAKQRIAFATLSLLLLAGCANNRGVIESPIFVARNTSALEIDKLELSDTATLLHINAFYEPGNWIKIDPNSFLADDKGNRYSIRSADGIVLGKEFYMPESGEATFTLNFPPVAPSATFVDFSEGDYEGAFKIWGIRLTDQPMKLHLNKGFKKAAIDQEAVLPPVEFRAGKARLEGQIVAYRSGMPAEVSVWVAYPFLYPPAEVVLPVDEKGNFSGEIDVYSTHPAWVRWTGDVARCFLAAGQTTTVVLNPVADNNPESGAFGQPAYFGGYLASLSKELAGLQSVFALDSRNAYETYYDFLESIENETPESLKTLFLNEYREKKAVLDTLRSSPAAKQVLRCTVDMAYAADVLNTTGWLERARSYKNERQRDPQAKISVHTARRYDIPNNFFDELKDFSFLNDPTILYLMELGSYARQWQLGQAQPLLSRILGTDRGPLFDVMKTIESYASIEDFTPVDAAQIEQLPAAYREFIREKNNALLELMKANENKTGYSINNIEKLPPAEVYSFILAKFKGKPILIDIWATWCGPCRVANEELKPVKEELAAAGKDIVYVFVAGNNSPLGTWTNMIPDLHGQHFRLTEAQWNHLGQSLGLHAVPTYLFVDRQGNVKEKIDGYPGLATMKEKILQIAN